VKNIHTILPLIVIALGLLNYVVAYLNYTKGLSLFHIFGISIGLIVGTFAIVVGIIGLRIQKSLNRLENIGGP
jgi:hypothetical protein